MLSFCKIGKAIQLFLIRREPINIDEKNEFLNNTYFILLDYIHYIEKNTLIIDDELIKVSNAIVELYKEAISTQAYAVLMEHERPSEAWKNAIDAKKIL